MVHWIHLPVALAPDRPYDINGVLTGSTTIVNGVPIIMYAGIDENNEQIICQARPVNISDPTLTEWIKSPMNPLITQPFGRDPATAFQDDQNNYYLIYGYGTAEEGGQAVLFTSKDFVNWTYLHPIHSNHYDIFWECPDIFNISNRIVMKASLCAQDFWAVGRLDPINKTFSPLAGDLGEYTQLIDSGKFYASKTFYDPIGHQQIIVGWIAEDDNQGELRGWQGLHTLPRTIFLSDDGLQLRSRPIVALQSLRMEESHLHYHNIVLPSTAAFQLLPNATGDQIEVIVNWQFPKDQDLDFGLTVLSTLNGSQQTRIGVMTRANISFMPNLDVPGYDYFSVPNMTDPYRCQRACDEDVKCCSWAFVSTEPVNANCFLKTGIPRLDVDSRCTSGVKQQQGNQQLVWIYINRTLSQQNPEASHFPLAGTLWLESQTFDDRWFLQLNIFIDHSVIEVFEPEGGRVAITTRVYPEEETAENIALYVNESPTTNQSIIMNTFDIWTLNSIWT